MKLYAIETPTFKLDGGAMFGVVPKTVWGRYFKADAQNRILMAARCLLIEDSNRLILIDTGIGDKQQELFSKFYEVDTTHTLETSLASKGFSFDDITDVFLTHLHFDHCGGAVNTDLKPTFPNATYWSNSAHWHNAENPNIREKASFMKENIQPLKQSNQLKFVDKEEPHFPFSIFFCDGHTHQQMAPIIPFDNKIVAYGADLFPTAYHLPLHYLTSYDVMPLKSMAEKNTFLHQAIADNYLLFLEHDPYNELISLSKTEKGIRMNQSYQVESYFN